MAEFVASGYDSWGLARGTSQAAGGGGKSGGGGAAGGGHACAGAVCRGPALSAVGLVVTWQRRNQRESIRVLPLATAE